MGYDATNYLKLRFKEALQATVGPIDSTSRVSVSLDALRFRVVQAHNAGDCGGDRPDSP